MGFLSDLIGNLFSGKEKKKYINLAPHEPESSRPGDLNLERTMQIDIRTLSKQRYIVKTNGEYSVFDSKDDMPDEFREGVELMEHSDSAETSYIVLVHGERQTYSSYDEMPEDIRTAIENA
jgi:hypothetical protein